MHPSRSLKISTFLTLFFSFLTGSGISQAALPASVDLARCWSYPLSESPAVSIAADRNNVYMALSGGKVESIGLGGRKVWSADLGGMISSNVLSNGNSVIVATSPALIEGAERSDAVLRSLSKETGVTQWSAALAPGDVHYLHHFNGWIIAVSKTGSVRAIDASGGKLVWKREISSGFAGKPYFSSGSLLIAGLANQVFKISLLTGEIDGLRTNLYPVSSLLITTDGLIIIGDERGNINSIRMGVDRPVWRFKTGGQLSTLIDTGSDLLAASHDNFVYSLDSVDGDVVWKRRLSGRLSHAIRVSDSYVLLSSIDDNGAVLVALNSGKIVAQMTFAENEKLFVEPVASEGSIFLATSAAIYRYSVSTCDPNSTGGRG